MKNMKTSRNHRATGGVNEAEMDLNDKPEARTDAKNIDAEAEERKHGGHVKHRRTARRHGGMAKHVGAMQGEGSKQHAGRKPRKSGGRAASDVNPFSSARHGTPPKGRTLDMEQD